MSDIGIVSSDKVNSAVTPVVPVLGKRKMLMFVLNKNEINLLSIINAGMQACLGFISFFIGIITTLFITKISMTKESYLATPLATIFPGTITISIVLIIGLAILMWYLSRKKSAVLNVVEAETVHEVEVVLPQ